jgi:hypothetical protein
MKRIRPSSETKAENGFWAGYSTYWDKEAGQQKRRNK